MSSFENYCIYQKKTTPSRETSCRNLGNDGFTEQLCCEGTARLLHAFCACNFHAFCACNYKRLPLARQHKMSDFASRFTPSRRFL